MQKPLFPIDPNIVVPGSPLDLVHILSLLLTLAPRGPHPSAGEPPASPEAGNHSVLPLLINVTGDQLCITTNVHYAHFQRKKKIANVSENQSAFLFKECCKDPADSKVWAANKRFLWRKGIAGRSAEPSSSRGLPVCRSGEKKTAEGEGWARPGASPWLLSTAQNFMAKFDLYPEWTRVLLGLWVQKVVVRQFPRDLSGPDCGVCNQGSQAQGWQSPSKKESNSRQCSLGTNVWRLGGYAAWGWGFHKKKPNCGKCWFRTTIRKIESGVSDAKNEMFSGNDRNMAEDESQCERAPSN